MCVDARLCADGLNEDPSSCSCLVRDEMNILISSTQMLSIHMCGRSESKVHAYSKSKKQNDLSNLLQSWVRRQHPHHGTGLLLLL